MDYKQLLPNEPSWLKDRTILLGKVGSHAYGTATATSDLDYKGIVIPPIEYFLGLESFDGYDKSGGKNFKNQAGDIDVTLLHINKFVRDAMAGVPNNLELLYLEVEDYLHIDEAGAELIEMRHHFLSKQIMKKFGGYAKSQTQKLQGKAARSELVDKFGYDTKNYMHAVRLLESAIQILNYNHLSVKRLDFARLLALREGFHSLDEALAYLERLEQVLQRAYEESTLPESPDYKLINQWLIDFNARYTLFEQ